MRLNNKFITIEQVKPNKYFYEYMIYITLLIFVEEYIPLAN